jgi:hypothetical protein
MTRRLLSWTPLPLSGTYVATVVAGVVAPRHPLVPGDGGSARAGVSTARPHSRI